MKRLKNLFVALALHAPLTTTAQDIEINAENFPDENFRSYLLSQSYGADGVIAEAEIKSITSISVYSKDISSLKGIEHFTALTSLSCSSNQLTTLDVSNNAALKSLDCSYNQLTALDVSKNTALTSLSCGVNQLTALDVSNNMALTTLYCFHNQLTALDVSKNTALTTLGCYVNQLTALDISKNTALTILMCNGNQFEALDVSNNTELTELECSNNWLTALDVSKNTALTRLSCIGNQLTALDVSSNTALAYLYCYCNQLKGELMDAFIESLPEKEEEKRLCVYNEGAEDEGNIMTKSQVAAAKAKGWTPYCTPDGLQWIEYEGSDDTATSIALPEIENGRAAVYTLDGKKVSTPVKGSIYIVDGKKVVVK